jgi:hypothetical protein
MATLNLRVGNDTLTHQEVDDNFTNINNEVLDLQNDKLDAANGTGTGTHTFNDVDVTTNLDVGGNITATRLNASIRGKMQALGSISGSTTIDLDDGDIVTCTITGNTTFTVSNFMAGAVNTVSFYITWSAASTPTITWPSGVVWDRGNTPGLNTTGSTLIMLETYDQGSNWIGVQSWRSYST